MKSTQEKTEYLVHLKIEPIEDGYYLGTSDNLPGLVVEGETPKEVLEEARNVAQMLIECY